MRGERRVFEIALPVVATGVFFWVLDALDLITDEVAIWALGAMLLVTAAINEVVRARYRQHVRLRSATLIFGSATVIYATGWGPVLIIGFMYGITASVRTFGSRAVFPALAASLAAVGLGQLAVEFDVAPSLIGEGRLAHGLATLGGLGLLFPSWVVYTTAARKEASEAQLVHQAFYDPLTRLSNRTLFLERLSAALEDAAERRGTVAVLFVDIDRFKVVNDSLGHEVGDLLLSGVAQRIASCVRPGDTVGRLGGDEFTVVLDSVTSVDDAVNVAERIREELNLPFFLHGYEVVSRASIGIALSGPDRVVGAERLLRDADVAMYHAKRRGGARYEIFDEDMGVRALRRLDLEARLRKAIDNRDFTLAFQPEVALGSGDVVGVETLARWTDARHGPVPLDDVIPVAEETGLIVPLGRWVLEEACRQAREWFEEVPESRPVMVAVNISTRQFLQTDLVSEVSAIIGAARIDPRRLRLEITESAVMQEAARGIGLVHELKELGVQIALDDFGTGHSSLSALSNLPADVIKIDRSFVGRLMTDPDVSAIVDAVTMMAHQLDLRVVAEGVETGAQLGLLRRLGCDTVQGYLLSEPVPADEAGELMRSGNYPIDALVIEPADDTERKR